MNVAGNIASTFTEIMFSNSIVHVLMRQSMIVKDAREEIVHHHRYVPSPEFSETCR